MRRKTLLFFISVFYSLIGVAQKEKKYSAVNPALFLYKTEDVYINPPVKYNNGKNLIKPNPTAYPWESRLENGMPNVIKDANGNLSIYISSFISFASKPPSKVGALVYTNRSNDITNWQRPNAGLYWYNANGTTSDEKIVGTYQEGYQNTNIVAVDIESLGIYDDHETTNKPIKLIYLPQRESHNKVLSAYEMDKTFTEQGILQGFSLMKSDRLTNQKNFTFDFINGDTHMNFLKQDGNYYFVSRLNAKRSALKNGETLPMNPDQRKRYRRETVTKVGEQLTSKNVELNVALDMSDLRWEPYSMQPFRLPGFEDDIWWGLVTMFGTEGDAEVQHKQRTELAISNDGKNWYYLKPGVPFLDNGTDPTSDDYGCINIAKPVVNTRFSADPMAAYYFYAASNIRHINGRNPGISLATGNYGKVAGLHADGMEKRFCSMIPSEGSVSVENMPTFSVANAFREGTNPLPQVLADVTVDPRGLSIDLLNSYVAVLLYAYSESAPGGKGAFLGGSLGSSMQGTSTVSEEYEYVPFVYNGIYSGTKQHLLNYLKSYSDAHPTSIVSLKDFEEFPIVMEAWVKNATFYGLKFTNGNGVENAGVNFYAPSHYQDAGLWSYTPETPTDPCYTEDFSQTKRLPNQKFPLDKETGSFALSVTPTSTANYPQTILRMYGDENNDIGIYYGTNGDFQYIMKKDGIPFASMAISPPAGKSFANKNVVLTLEAVKNGDRKYGSNLHEESAIFRVSCNELGFEEIVQQNILWNWKHAEGSITAADSANARAFAYLASTAFVAGMDTISVGGSNSHCSNQFLGSIHHVELADHLPTWSSDFWKDSAETRSVENIDDDKRVSEELSMSIYPNPLKKGDNLQLLINSTQSHQAELQLLDITGKLILSKMWNVAVGENRIEWNLSHLGSGYYILVYSSDKNRISRKLMIIE